MKAQRYTFGWSHVYAYFLLYIWYFQSSWKWFIYTRAQNVNRKHSDDGRPKKKSKFDSMKKHGYPPIPSSATDEVSDERNMRLLKEEWSKTKQVADSIKELFMCTHAIRRSYIELRLHRCWQHLARISDAKKIYICKFKILSLLFTFYF